jgi:hypothetical protein
MSLESAPDRSYDVPPADERKGKAKAEGDRHLGIPKITHWSTLTRYPADTVAGARQKNVADVKNYWRGVRETSAPWGSLSRKNTPSDLGLHQFD